MTKTAAMKQAKSESSMYYQGRGSWVVSTWDETAGAYRVDNGSPHAKARESLTVWRAQRAAELVLGRPLDERDDLGAVWEAGSLSHRVDRVLAGAHT